MKFERFTRTSMGLNSEMQYVRAYPVEITETFLLHWPQNEALFTS